MSVKLRIVFYFLWVQLAFYSCNSKPDNVLSKQEMTDFLVDLHKLDGALNAKGMGSYDNRTNIYYYNALLKKYNITKAQFDSSLVWYTKNPKKFEKIYVDVVEQLTKLDEQVKSGYFHPVDSVALRNKIVNVWPVSRTKFVLTKDSVKTKMNFVVKTGSLAWNDVYKFSFLHKSVSLNKNNLQKVVFKIHYGDKVSDSIVCKLLSDSVLRRYTITMTARRQHRIDSLSVMFLNYKNSRLNLDSLKLNRRFDSLAQDSIMRVVYLIENPIPNAFPVKPELRLRSKVILQRKNELPQ